MNYVHLIGTICSRPTTGNIIMKCGNNYIHIKSNTNANIGQYIEIEGELISYTKNLYGNNVTAHLVDVTNCIKL